MLHSTLLDDCGLRIARARRALSLRLADERGFGTLFATLISLTGATAILASASLTDAGFSFDQLTDTVRASVDRVGASLEVRGSVIARSAGGSEVESIELTLGVFGEGNPVSVDMAAPATERLVVAYLDGDTYHPDVPYTARFIGGDGDLLLEPGEMVSIVVHTDAIESASLGAGERFTLELLAPIGGSVDISRRLPPMLDNVMSLH